MLLLLLAIGRLDASTGDEAAGAEQGVTLTGSVRDESGGAIVGARVIARCGDRARETETQDNGTYRIVSPGPRGILEVSRAGFEPVVRQFDLEGRKAGEQNFVLAIAHAVASVSVNASEGYLATSSAAATKTNALLVETPQSVSVITSEQLFQRGVQTLNEALRFTPGVAVEAYGVDPRFDSFLIRGFGDDTNAVFLDGLRFPGYLGQPDPHLAEDVAVVKGPSSVLYGQSAPGGLVNITSKRPPEHSLHEVELDLGSYGRKQVAGDFGGLFDREGRLRYRLMGLYRDSATQVNYSPDDRWLLAPAFTWVATEKTSLTLLSYYQRDHSGWAQFLPAQGTLLGNPWGTIPVDFFTGIPGFDGVHRTQWSAGYIFDHRFNRTWAFRQSFRSYDVRYDGATAYGTGLAADLRTLTRAAYTFLDTDTLYAVDNQAQAKLRTGALTHSLLAGYDFSRTSDYPQGAYGAVAGIDVFAPKYSTQVPELTPYLDERQQQRQSGIYLQDQLQFAEHWTVLVSGREDFVNGRTQDRITGSLTPSSFNHFSGRAGVSYSAQFGLAPYVSYSTSFLPVLGVNYYGNPYVPTTGRQFEAGLKFQPARRHTLVTASFFNIDQAHVQSTDPNNALNTIQVGQVRSRGAEIEAISHLQYGFTLHAAYAYDDAKVTKTTTADQLGKYLVSVPRQTASSFLEYEFPKGPLAGLGAGVGARYVGRQAGSADNSLELPGYTLFDAWLHYDWKYARLGVNATNVGNRRYVGVCNSLAYCNYGFARRVIGSITFRW